MIIILMMMLLPLVNVMVDGFAHFIRSSLLHNLKMIAIVPYKYSICSTFISTIYGNALYSVAWHAQCTVHAHIDGMFWRANNSKFSETKIRLQKFHSICMIPLKEIHWILWFGIEYLLLSNSGIEMQIHLHCVSLMLCQSERSWINKWKIDFSLRFRDEDEEATKAYENRLSEIANA